MSDLLILKINHINLAVLGGHYYACPACSEAIDKAGIAKLVFDPETAAKAREFYKLS